MSSRIQFTSRFAIACSMGCFSIACVVGCGPKMVEAPVSQEDSSAILDAAAVPGEPVPPDLSIIPEESLPNAVTKKMATSPPITTSPITESIAEDTASTVDGESSPAPVDAMPEPDSGPLTTAELEEEYVPDPEILAELEAQRKALRRLADTYDPPPQAKQLGKEADLWVDLQSKRVYIDGYVSMKRGPLEMLACPVGTKEHESVIALFAKSSDVHAALLAVGAQSGTTARWDPEFMPPNGQTVLVWIAYRDPKELPKADGDPKPQPFVPDEEFKVVDARKWIRRIETQEELAEPWVFSGSSFWTDPDDGVEYYSANAGDMICVSNFSTAMMDVPFASSADAGNILFEPFEERIPMRGTPVRLILAPQPISDDSPEDAKSSKSTDQPNSSQTPTQAILPMPKQ